MYGLPARMPPTLWPSLKLFWSTCSSSPSSFRSTRICGRSVPPREPKRNRTAGECCCECVSRTDPPRTLGIGRHRSVSDVDAPLRAPVAAAPDGPRALPRRAAAVPAPVPELPNGRGGDRDRLPQAPRRRGRARGVEARRDPLEDVPAHLLRGTAPDARPGRSGERLHGGEGDGARRRGDGAPRLRPPR